MTAQGTFEEPKPEKRPDLVDDFYKISKKLGESLDPSEARKIDLPQGNIPSTGFVPDPTDEAVYLDEFLSRLLSALRVDKGGLFALGRCGELTCLCDHGIRRVMGPDDRLHIHQLVDEAARGLEPVDRSTEGRHFVVLPLPIDLGGMRHVLLLHARGEGLLERARELGRSWHFLASCRLLEQRLLTARLLRDPASGRLPGDTFFRMAEMLFGQAVAESRPFAFGVMLLAAGGSANVDSASTAVEGEIIAGVKGLLKGANLFSLLEPEMVVFLLSGVPKKEFESLYRRAREVFGGFATPRIGVSYFAGSREVEFPEILMTLSQAFDACLEGKADFIVKEAGMAECSRFSFSDRAGDLLFQSIDHRKLLMLYKISRIFAQEYRIEPLFQRILDLSIEALGAERGLLCMPNEEGEIEIIAARNTEGTIRGEMNEISRSIVADAVSGRRPVFSRDVGRDENLKGRNSILRYGIRSVLCMPIHRGTNLLGVLYLDVQSTKKRFDLSDLIFLRAIACQAVTAIENARLHEGQRSEIQRLKAAVSGGVPGIVGQSEGIREVLKKVEAVRESDVTVLLEGESGTGKELIAKTIHSLSPRKDRPFLTIDCSSISDTLIESELFGHLKGAFTGARRDREGLFEAADGGTVFLDEVDSLKLSVQGSLLRAIEEGEIRRLGENRYRKVDVRLITTTKSDLEGAVRRGEFREDLYYRLQVFRIHIPPLRGRKEDIPLIADHFLRLFASQYGKELKGFHPEAMEALVRHSWPGNVRELRNTVERAVVNSLGDVITSSDLGFEREKADRPLTAEGLSLQERMNHAQREAICEALRKNRGNVTAAARGLGLSRRGLQKLIQRHGIDRHDFI